ncbi:HalOD1 output domain-containing protein [Haloarcula marina]|uniref:HalOD1 output domain-containing protein n=1 Tax=Haloarcula marina TaxID=2961574 RepID=UPI0020B6D71B|nr:HalOD1 output domain-containing protein [Halomicroarcula marina]
MDDSAPPEDRRPSGNPVWLRILQQVATETEQDISALPPLYESIDVEILEALINSAHQNNTPLSLQLKYAGKIIKISLNNTASGEDSIHIS